MNILLAVPWKDFDPAGGVNVVVHTLGAYYARHGDHVAFLAAKWGGAPEESSFNGIPLYWAAMRAPLIEAHPWRSRIGFGIRFPLTCWQLGKILKRGRFEIVNAHYFGELVAYWVYLRRLLPFRLVVSVHGSDVLGEKGEYHLRLLEHWSPYIDKIVFCSAGFREQTISRESPLYKKSVVILNGIAPPEVPAASNEGNYIACVAHLREHKGQDVLLHAFRRLADTFPDLQLYLIGDGPFRQDLERLVPELGLSSRVKFWGEIPREKSLELLKGARVMCLPSRREPFPTVVLEAMASKIPIVATRVGGIPEQIQSGIDGLLVPPDSPLEMAAALHTVLTDKEGARQFTENAYERFSRCFTTERFGTQYRELLQQLDGDL